MTGHLLILVDQCKSQEEKKENNQKKKEKFIELICKSVVNTRRTIKKISVHYFETSCGQQCYAFEQSLTLAHAFKVVLPKLFSSCNCFDVKLDPSNLNCFRSIQFYYAKPGIKYMSELFHHIMESSYIQVTENNYQV